MRTTSAVTVVTGILAVSALLSAAVPTPRAILGGTFEASGVAHVPDTNGVLFVDDGRTREVFWMELADDGTQRGRAVPIPLTGADVTDLEGITSDGSRFYVVGSQSKKVGYSGDGLVRFTFNTATRTVGNVERVQGLKAWLHQHVSELKATAGKVGDKVLNIEAIAWDPRGERLLLGLRAPVVDGQALVVPVGFRDPSAPFTIDNLVFNGPAIRLALGGAGIRSLEFDERAGMFRVITGADLNRERVDFRVLEWNGDGQSPAVKELATFSRTLKPEGITFGHLSSGPASVIVFDTGRFTLFQ